MYYSPTSNPIITVSILCYCILESVLDMVLYFVSLVILTTLVSWKENKKLLSLSTTNMYYFSVSSQPLVFNKLELCGQPKKQSKVPYLSRKDSNSALAILKNQLQKKMEKILRSLKNSILFYKFVKFAMNKRFWHYKFSV